MAVAAVAFIFSLLLYLSLTAGSGTVLQLWSAEELAAGIIFSAVTAVLSTKLLGAAGVRGSASFLNPLRIAKFIAYAIGPFLWSMTKANLDVAARVVTGRINPGIVKVPTGLKTGFGMALLANSITLTPGTLSVDVDGKDLHVHCIHLKSKDPAPEEVCGSFIKWARRITE